MHTSERVARARTREEERDRERASLHHVIQKLLKTHVFLLLKPETHTTTPLFHIRIGLVLDTSFLDSSFNTSVQSFSLSIRKRFVCVKHLKPHLYHKIEGELHTQKNHMIMAS